MTREPSPDATLGDLWLAWTEARAEIAQLRALVQDLAHDLEEELMGHYNGTLDYPSEQRRFERDMENVYRARAALEAKP